MKCFFAMTVFFLLVKCNADEPPVANQKKDTALISLEVTEQKPRNRGSDIVLVFALTNRSPKEIRIEDHKLPWKSFSGLFLIVKTADVHNNQLLERAALPFADPQIALRTIKPGETIKGEVRLNAFFENVAKAARFGLDVYWTYQISTIDDTKLHRLGGWLYIEPAK